MARPREVTENGINLIRSNHVDHSLQRAADRINAMKLEECLFKKDMSHVVTNPVVLKERPQLRPEQGRGLQHPCDIRSRKVRSDIKQKLILRFGDFISEAVAEVQSDRVNALAPLRVGIRNLLRCGW